MDKKKLIDIVNLTKKFRAGKQEIAAVNNVTLSLYEKETVGLVGESGSGKTTVGKMLLRLIQPTSGDITFDGIDILRLSKEEMRPLRRRMQMIFQDPYASLNPRMTVEDIIGEPLDIHHLAPGPKRHERVVELLHLVGLNAEHSKRFPHEFSGGQRQRIGIARALAVEPQFLVCDEPISALDVSIQAQIVNLLKRLREQMGLTYLFIAHDLATVKYLSDRVAVMYLGHMVELAETEDLYREPLHPYTQMLLSAIPIPDPEKERKRLQIAVKHDVLQHVRPTQGCIFQHRCPYAMPICKQTAPEMIEAKPSHFVSCFLAEKGKAIH